MDGAGRIEPTYPPYLSGEKSVKRGPFLSLDGLLDSLTLLNVFDGGQIFYMVK